MKRLPMMGQAETVTQHTSPAQFWFFVCVGRGNSAVIVEACIGRDQARRAAKQRGGRVVGGYVGPRSLGTVTYAVIPTKTTTPEALRLALGR